MINIVVGLTQTKLANLANTKVKREVLAAFINFSPLPVTKYLQTRTKTETLMKKGDIQTIRKGSMFIADAQTLQEENLSEKGSVESARSLEETNHRHFPPGSPGVVQK